MHVVKRRLKCSRIFAELTLTTVDQKLFLSHPCGKLPFASLESWSLSGLRGYSVTSL